MNAKLFPHFRPQKNNTYCGLASTAIVLSALNDKTIEEEDIIKIASISSLNQENISNSGVSLSYLEDILNSIDEFKTEGVKGIHADQIHSAEILRHNLVRYLDRGSFIFMNYLLDFDLGGIGEGHHSPLTAYNQTADMFLILDVWKFSEPFWIKTDLLY